MQSTPRVAVITGASQGIGAGLVAGYRAVGYAVVANSRTIDASDDPLVATVAGDIGIPGVGQRIIDTAIERFGRVDTVVNNAGIFVAKPFTEYTDADYDAVTGVNLRGFFEVTRAALAAMLPNGSGHIVNISTTLVDHGWTQRSDEGIGHRVRLGRDPVECRGAGRHPHPDACAVDARRPGGTASARSPR